MSRPTLAALLLLALPNWALAQGGDSPPATQQDPQAAYDNLVKDLNKAMAEWQTAAQAAYEKAKAEGAKSLPAIAMNPPTKEFIGRAQELAAQYAGTDDAVRFLGFIVKSASQERNAVKKAVETLASDHAKSPAIGDVIEHLGMAINFGAKKQVMSLLDEVVANHADADCKAKAMVTRGTIRLEGARNEADRKAAEEDLRGVAKVTKDEGLLQQAKDALFEIEHLQIGCTAPEIAGVDTEGVAFKLSDYRGKVVLLDFWGFW